MDLGDVIIDKRQAIKTICSQYGVPRVRVFGSFAREDYSPDSDIDLLVDFDGQWDLGKLYDLQDELEKLLGSKVDVGPDAAPPHPRQGSFGSSNSLTCAYLKLAASIGGEHPGQ